MARTVGTKQFARTVDYLLDYLVRLGMTEIVMAASPEYYAGCVDYMLQRTSWGG